jgi:peptidoglycan/LPS O-acetylase OafA/YrhL
MLQSELLYRATPFQLDALLLGGLVALLLRGPHRRRILEIGKIIAFCATCLFVMVLVVGIAHSYPNWRSGYRYPAWKFTWGLTIVDLIAAGVILCALRPSGAVYRFLNLRVLRWVGRISYGAYIFHDIFHIVYQAIIVVIGSHFQFVANNAEEFVPLLGLTCTLLISWLSFRYFESVFINLKERWTVSQHRSAFQASLNTLEGSSDETHPTP